MKEILKSGSEQLGINLSEEQLKQLIGYSALLKEWNEIINLCAITVDEGIAT